ncbi:MAG: IgGFc-binding protein [Deltaproteobacteria bacterium]|nr:IgGFc-binding protein [Deltaproteobacteria bacterium]
MESRTASVLAAALSIGALSITAVVPVACSSDSSTGEGTGGNAGDASTDGKAGTNLLDSGQCLKGQYRCTGNIAKQCDGNGGFTTEKDCGDTGTCADGLGCVVCTPGSGTCANGKATWCNPDGTVNEQFDCDPLQGLTCEPNGCKGKCAPSELYQTYVGCDYYPTVTLNPVWNGFPFAVGVANTSADVVKVTITRGSSTITTADVPAHGAKVIELPWVAELKGGDVDACQMPPAPGATRVVQGGAFRLRTDGPVTVYQFSPLSYKISPTPAQCPIGKNCPGGNGEDCLAYSNDASLLLPRTALTPNYTVLTWPSQKDRAGFATITAIHDNTLVKVFGAGAVSAGAGIDASGNGSATLSAGDVLEVVGAYNAAAGQFGSDLSGMRIQADKAVQVIAGHSCANTPDPTIPACDHLEEGLFPVETLGTEYLVTVPDGLPDASPHVVRVVAIDGPTKVTFDPAVMPETTISPGDPPLEIKDLTQNIYVKADKAILVAQFMQSQESVPNKIGDPSISLAIPTKQFRAEYVFVASSTFDANFVNVISKAGSTVTLDGTAMTDVFSPIGNSGYQVARHQLDSAEQHTITSSQPFGIVVYGYGQYTSYMYPGGLDLKHITVPPIY